MKFENVKCSFVYCVIAFFGLLAHNTWATSTYVGGDCNAINGMYVSLGQGQAGALLGDTAQENTLLKFSRDNGINYFIFYDLNGLVANSTRATQLASLISRARNQYGIQQVGAALGTTTGANNIVAYNNAHATNERIDVLNLESEFWNEADRATALNNVINILDSFRSLAQANNMETEYYIGWLNDATEGARIGNAVDRVLVHFYRKDDVGIINYGIERLQYLASASRKVRIAPIFSNEGPTNTGDPTSYFMGPWLDTHPNDQAFKTWMAGYNAINASWKSNIEVMGGTWFLYNYFPSVYSGKPNHITSNPVSQTACTGDTKTFTVASSATTKNYCWMKDNKCLADGGNISGSKTASLTVSNITSADYGNYIARVISYDSGNPTSFASTTASLTAATSCGGATNIALGKTMSASSYVAAGYEPSKANDGNATTTRWASAYTGPQWLQVDLGANYNVNRVKVTWENAYATAYQILFSTDGSTWVNARSISGNTSLINDQTGLVGTARYVRINGTANALPAWGYSIFEVEVYGSAASTSSNRALNKTVTVSSVEAAGLEGNKAVDGDSTTRWASAYTDTQWLQVDLGATYTINRVKITWEVAYGKNYKIQTSTNGTNWTDVKTINNNATLVNDITGLNSSARYVRMYGVKRATSYGYSIYEFEVY